MAPTSFGMNAMHTMRIEARGLGGNNTSTAPSLSPSQRNSLQDLALTFSLLSVASSLLAFYWFVKMRRTFRHDLVMLLIQSDMFKALWFMIYPIVTFVHGPVKSESTFCQVNGFMIAVGVEASDIAVLMIAIHSAIYIFKPGAAAGEGGLYPYRRFSYFIWTVFPLLMASLAFINSQDGYVSEGTYCYLPVRPFWYRLALGWIPRYVIFIIILGIYASIYFYVRYKFQGFNKADKSNSLKNSQDSTARSTKRPKRSSVPPTPTLTCHGLIPDSRQDSMGEGESGRHSESTVDSSRPGNNNYKIGAHRFMLLASFAVDKDSPATATPPSEPSVADIDSFTGPSTPRPLPRCLTIDAPSPRAAISPIANSQTPLQSRATSWRDGFVRRFSPNNSGNTSTKHSVVDIFSVLRHHPDSPDTEPGIPHLELMNSRGQTFAHAEMLRTRDKIRRQLRFLFIYPLVYIGMWILPFVSHILQYKDKYATEPLYGLTCATTICICSQAAVDCWLFSTREKPWQHIPGTDGSFWASLKFWSGWEGVRKRRKARHGPGKTREEMVREAKAAYQRREQENAQRKSQAVNQNSAAESSRHGERSWWEAIGVDGAMSPVAEETPNPMEQVAMSGADNTSDGEATLQGTPTHPPGDVDYKGILETQSEGTGKK